MITIKNFNHKLQNLAINTKTVRDGAQELIEFGVLQYAMHGDTGYLTRLMQTCIGVRALPTQTIKEYIKAHANVVLVNRKDKGSGKTIKVFKKDGDRVETKDFKQTWYNWDGARHQATADMDETSQLKAFLSRLNKNIENGTVKNAEHAEKIKATLQDIDFLKAS